MILFLFLIALVIFALYGGFAISPLLFLLLVVVVLALAFGGPRARGPWW